MTRALAVLVAATAFAADKTPAPEIVGVDLIWSKGPHNAFTDLIRYRGRWYCVFREGAKHDSFDGKVRLLTSADGERWEPAALLADPRGDLRDPKLSVTPDQRLMLTAALSFHPPSEIRHQTLMWVSTDARDWGEPRPIGDPDTWLWRVNWHRGKAYSLGYGTGATKYLRGYISLNGADFLTLGENVHDRDYPNETAIVFRNDDSALCLLRRDGGAATAQLGRSRPPYRAWTWEDLGVRIGGPNLIAVPDGRLVAAVRLYDGGTRTSLAWLDPDEPSLKEFLTLPSGGDTSYAGLVYHDGLLWVSYYSTHESRSCIYLAKVKIPLRR
jgi:hypothetical protein